MEADRVAPISIDAFFSGGISLVIQGTDSEGCNHGVDNGGLIPGPNRNFDTFVRCLKVGMDEGAVRQKMLASGISSNEIDAFLCGVIDGAYPASSL
jgi:hypothetical protein